MFSLLVNTEQRRWQTWYHTHVDVCQCHLSRLVSAKDQPELLILFTCLSNLTFWCFKIFQDKIAEFTGTMYCISGWYRFWKRGAFACISVSIDLGDLPPWKLGQCPSECLSGFGDMLDVWLSLDGKQISQTHVWAIMKPTTWRPTEGIHTHTHTHTYICVCVSVCFTIKVPTGFQK